MRTFLTTLMIAGLAFAVATPVDARPKKVRRPGYRPGTTKPNNDKKDDKANNGRDSRRERRCITKSAMLRKDREKVENYTAEMTEVENIIAQLQKEVDEYRMRRAELKRDIKGAERQLRGSQGAYDKECKANEDCKHYETESDTLDHRGQRLKDRLARVRDDIRGGRDDMSGLRRKISPLQNEYAQKSCNNLVPGETSQQTIDRCSQIFSEWNRLQADLNRQNRNFSDLKARYSRILAELQQLENRGGELEKYLSRNCKNSRSLEVIRGYGAVRRNAETLGAELDSLIKDVTSLRGVKITITPKR
ncbi:hypothetical protein KAI87_05920 [Myxococcota bacterium]|nr:hypothetical protein [Myxococcota bacterium]